MADGISLSKLSTNSKDGKDMVKMHGMSFYNSDIDIIGCLVILDFSGRRVYLRLSRQSR